jgi:hypothetical protein
MAVQGGLTPSNSPIIRGSKALFPNAAAPAGTSREAWRARSFNRRI